MSRVPVHIRNVDPMQAAPRCGARTRSGTPCQSPGIAGGKRCRMHGGKGSGAPRGNSNAFKHGACTGAMLEQVAQVRSVVKEAEALIRSVHSRLIVSDESRE